MKKQKRKIKQKDRTWAVGVWLHWGESGASMYAGQQQDTD